MIHPDQAIRLGVGERPQHDGVEHRHDGGGGTDPEGEREHDDDRETGRAADAAPALPELAPQRLHIVGQLPGTGAARVDRARLGAPPGEIAEPFACRLLRLSARHSLRQQLVDALFQVKAQLVIELGIELSAARRQAEGAARAGGALAFVGHRAPSAVMTRWTASV